MSSLKDVAKGLLVNSMAAKAGESVLVLTDDTRLSIGAAIREAANELGCESMLMVMNEREVSGQEPPAAVAAAMAQCDVVMCPTAKSVTHTNARIEACKQGARIATMPGITEEMFKKGAVTADYAEVQILTQKLVALLDEATTARIEKDGCVLNIGLSGREGRICCGMYQKPGQNGNLPSGEAFIAPVEDAANGETVIDGSMVGIGKLHAPLKVRVENGKLVKIDGEHNGKLDILLKNERNATLAELGIGTNKQALLCGIILEDEKVYGTVHIAFGTNTSFGGTNKADCHMDGIILKPTLYIDNTLVIKDGEFVIA